MPNRDSPGSNVSLAVMLVGDKYWQKSTFNTHIMLIKTYHTVPFFNYKMLSYQVVIIEYYIMEK